MDHWSALMALPISKFLDVVRHIPAPGLLSPLPEPPKPKPAGLEAYKQQTQGQFIKRDGRRYWLVDGPACTTGCEPDEYNYVAHNLPKRKH